MSGQTPYNSTFASYLRRRAFLLRLGLITGSIFIDGCIKKMTSKKYGFKGSLRGPNAAAGHILRDKIAIAKPNKTVEVKILIVGSGISGLSAARWLKQNGEEDFKIIELENKTGGNSRSGKNNVSTHPLGAHYTTVANHDDDLLIDFFREHNVITHFENGKPYYNDYYLTFDPEERLLINGEWQEGLVPDFGVPQKDKQQIKDFLKEMENLKKVKGKDGNYLFTIPIANCSKDPDVRKLDNITFESYLKDKGYDSPYLLWYLNYACKDDYGQKIEKISAWAGLHYFASRRGKAANAEDNAVLTWPDGNAWLAVQMTKKLETHISTTSLCYEISETANGKIKAWIYNLATKQSTYIIAQKLILATPQYVNQELLKDVFRPNFDHKKLTYSPWLIANITVSDLPNAKGIPLCWDNVAYNMPSVGYVNATQQNISMINKDKVLTYYLPLCDYEPTISRLAAYTRTYEQWLDIIMPELTYIHPEIETAIKEIDLWVWGHGMIAPTPNLIFGDNLAEGRRPIDNKIFFAHTDLSGISIFEEAFHQGILAAKQVTSHDQA